MYVRVCVCVFFFCTITEKSILQHEIRMRCIVYENNSDEFDIEQCRIKVKVTVTLQTFSPFTTIQTVRSYNSTFAQARKIVLSRYVRM